MSSAHVPLRRIVITGAESSGKTTLADALAAHYGTLWVEEAARHYLEAKAVRGASGYGEHDLLRIAQQQVRAEEDRAGRVEARGGSLLFCDTDLITIRIWSEEKYGRCHPWIVRGTEERPYALWMLCAPDMPWEPDPFRENPDDRDRLFALYEALLQRLGKPYVILRGGREERLAQAVSVVDALG